MLELPFNVLLSECCVHITNETNVPALTSSAILNVYIASVPDMWRSSSHPPRVASPCLVCVSAYSCDTFVQTKSAAWRCALSHMFGGRAVK